jgi:LPS-assembly protein
VKLLGAALLLAVSPLAALAQDPYSQADPFESRFKAKPNFQVKFKVPEKGGEVRLYTKKPVRFEKDKFWEGSEEVVIEYQDIKITSDEAHYDFPTKTAVLIGHVVIDQGPTRLSADRGTFNLGTKTGILEDNAVANLPPSYHIVAQSIEKIGEATYRVHHGLFTSCDLPKPDWSFSMSEATITLDDYAHMKDVAFRAGSVPLMYTPYLVWPTKEDRASGFLVPGLGFSNQRGAYVGLNYYWVTGRSTDLTSQLDLYSDGTIGVGEQARWRPTDESAGIFNGFIVRDQDATQCVPLSQTPPGGGNGPCTLPDGSLGVYTTGKETRWKVALDHASDDLPYDIRGVVSIRAYSDEQFLQDWEKNFSLNSAKQVPSFAYLTRNIGADSVNLRFERTETFYAATVVQERLPSLEYFHRTAPIGDSPFFLAVESSLSGLYINKGQGLLSGTYGRFDLNPTVSFPVKEIPWLSILAQAGGRVTEYTNSTDEGQQTFTGDSFLRTYATAGVSLVGPSFSRIFDVDFGPWSKLKHVIEPRVDYTYVSNVSDPARIPAFDTIDATLGQNQVRYAIVNRLLARAAGGPAGSAEEIASLEIAQTYAFTLPQTIFTADTTGIVQRQSGPIEAILRIAGGSLVHVDAQAFYDPIASQLTSTSLTASANWASNYVNLSWFGNRPVAAAGQIVVNSDQIRFAGGVDLSKAFRFDASVAYDADSKLLQEGRFLVTYKGSCYTVFLEYRDLDLPPTPRRDLRLVVNLKDIGTLLDVNGSINSLIGQ